MGHLVLTFTFGLTLIISSTDFFLLRLLDIFGWGRTRVFHLRRHKGGSSNPCLHILPLDTLLVYLIFNLVGIVPSKGPPVTSEISGGAAQAAHLKYVLQVPELPQHGSFV